MHILFMESTRAKNQGLGGEPEVVEGLGGGGNALCLERCKQLQWACLESRAGETINSKSVHYLYALIKFFLKEII